MGSCVIGEQEDPLANLRSSIKRVRSSRRKAAHNQVASSTARTYVKKARRLIAEGNLDEAQRVVRQAASALDRAADKGVIHRNNASRRKSRLVQMLNKATK
jgi:small subunit ribosomal protein S20